MNPGRAQRMNQPTRLAQKNMKLSQKELPQPHRWRGVRVSGADCEAA
jgi:hypothetical protein